jgi:hypothetical protein
MPVSQGDGISSTVRRRSGVGVRTTCPSSVRQIAEPMPRAPNTLWDMPAVHEDLRELTGREVTLAGHIHVDLGMPARDRQICRSGSSGRFGPPMTVSTLGIDLLGDAEEGPRKRIVPDVVAEHQHVRWRRFQRSRADGPDRRTAAIRSSGFSRSITAFM